MRKFALALIVLAGCGIAGTTLLVDLTDDDKTTICEDEVASVVEQTVDCDGIEVTYEAGTVSDCVAGFDGLTTDCGAVLDDWYDCNDALEADPCLIFAETLPAACETVFSCYEM